MRIIDISRTTSPETLVYPGDTPFCVRYLTDSPIQTSEVRFTPHVGTHIDAPWHFAFGQPGLADVDLNRFVGCARVVEPIPRPDATEPDQGHHGAEPDQGHHAAEPDVLHDVIDLTDVSEEIFCERRILFKVKNSSTGLSEALARRLAQAGVLLVGISSPSIDPASETEYPAHRALLGSGVFLLENLNLAHVEPGRYELHAAPLKWTDTEATPTRAYLVLPTRNSSDSIR